MKTFTKKPSDLLDYDVELEDWFADLGGDSIEHVELAVAPGGLELGPGVFPEYALIDSPSYRFKVWVGGGEHGALYKVTAVVFTQTGRRKEVDFQIQVIDR